MISKTCCFSGHRPKSFPWGYNEKDKRCVFIKSRIEEEIRRAIALGYTRFIAGGAVGVDMWCAETVLMLKKEFPNIRLVIAMPFMNYAEHFGRNDKKRLIRLIDESDERVLTADENDTSPLTLKYYRRNEYMVDNSSMLIAVYEDDGKKRGGTRYTVNYAMKNDCRVNIIKWKTELAKIGF